MRGRPQHAPVNVSIGPASEMASPSEQVAATHKTPATTSHKYACLSGVANELAASKELFSDIRSVVDAPPRSRAKCTRYRHILQ